MRLRAIASELSIPEIELVRWAQGRIRTGFPSPIDRYDDGTKDFDLAEIVEWIDTYEPAAVMVEAAQYSMKPEQYIVALRRLPALLGGAEGGQKVLDAVGLVRKK